MPLKDYERFACVALDLPHPDTIKEEKGLFLDLGTIELFRLTECIDAGIKRYKGFQAGFLNSQIEDGYITNEEANQIIKKSTPLEYEKYCDIVKNISSHIKTLREIEATDKETSSQMWYTNHQSEKFNISDQERQRLYREYDTAHLQAKRNVNKVSIFIEQISYSGLQLVSNFNHEYFKPNFEGYQMYLATLYTHLAPILNLTGKAYITEKDRKMHTYITGGSGSGKTEMIKTIIHNYVVSAPDTSVIVLDPHGDLVEQVAKWKEFKDNDRLVYVDPFLIPEHSPTINPFEHGKLSPIEKDAIAQHLVGAFEQLLSGDGSVLSSNMQALIKPCLLVLLDIPNSTIKDLQLFLDDENNDFYINKGKQNAISGIRDFFKQANGFNNSSYARTKTAILAKLQNLRNTIAFDNLLNGKTTLKLEEYLNQGKVILFNLSKGKIGKDASQAFGCFVLALVQGLAFRRQSIPAEQRKPIHMFIDECQNYISPATIEILEETRKYGLHLTLAQQIAGRGMSNEMKNVVLNNTNIKIAGRTKEDNTISSLIGCSIEQLQQLETGCFYVQTGNKPAYMMKNHTDLLGNSNTMTAKQWEATIAKQKQYYQSTAEDLEQETEKAEQKELELA
jgi:hypothetical protein